MTNCQKFLRYKILIWLVAFTVMITMLENKKLDASRRPTCEYSDSNRLQLDNKQGQDDIYKQKQPEAGKPIEKPQFDNKTVLEHNAVVNESLAKQISLLASRYAQSAQQKNEKGIVQLMQTMVTKQPDYHIILLWNKLYSSDFDKIGNDGLKYVCPKLQCVFTHDKTLLSKADAVLFHMWKDDPWDYFPPTRSANQHYVFLLNESPARCDYHLNWYDHFFNLTMTYRRDSDIPWLYGSIHPRQSPIPVTSPWWVSEMAVMKAKKKPVVWMSGHCTTDSKREEYIKELQKYINIDMYGGCGNLECWPPRSRECYNLIRENYRFVLAFENSICRDYITEKLYENLESGVVPVVFGGATYTDLLPPHSYINVADFSSPRHLASYLSSLMHDNVEYLKYFQWKRSFDVSAGSLEWQHSFCKLCDFLHHPTNHHKSYSARELNDHWGSGNCDPNYLKAIRNGW